MTTTEQEIAAALDGPCGCEDVHHTVFNRSNLPKDTHVYRRSLAECERCRAKRIARALEDAWIEAAKPLISSAGYDEYGLASRRAAVHAAFVAGLRGNDE